MAVKKRFDIQIYESRNFVVNQDWEMPIPGFFIVAPKRKVFSITELNEEELIEYAKVMRKIREAMRTVLKIEDVVFYQHEKNNFGFHTLLLPIYDFMMPFEEGDMRSSIARAINRFSNHEGTKKIELAAKRVRTYLEM